MHNKRIFITLGIMLLLLIYNILYTYIQNTTHTGDEHFFVDKSRSTLFLGRDRYL